MPSTGVRRHHPIQRQDRLLTTVLVRVRSLGVYRNAALRAAVEAQVAILEGVIAEAVAQVARRVVLQVVEKNQVVENQVVERRAFREHT